MVQVNVADMFNFVKAFATHTIAKAESVLTSAFSGSVTDLEKVAAQGAHSVGKDLLSYFNDKIVDPSFNLADETQSLLTNIQTLDPTKLFPLATVAPIEAAPVATDAAVSAPIDAQPIEGEVIAPAVTD